jgi:hypothetical protein
MSPSGSHWYGELCRRYVVLEGAPKRRRCRGCLHWMVRRWPSRKRVGVRGIL